VSCGKRRRPVVAMFQDSGGFPYAPPVWENRVWLFSSRSVEGRAGPAATIPPVLTAPRTIRTTSTIHPERVNAPRNPQVVPGGWVKSSNRIHPYDRQSPPAPLSRIVQGFRGLTRQPATRPYSVARCVIASLRRAGQRRPEVRTPRRSAHLKAVLSSPGMRSLQLYSGLFGGDLSVVRVQFYPNKPPV
jgi:hypothetical protein